MSGLCGIYLRVSTGPQAEKGTSLDVQEAICRKAAATAGKTVIGVYKDAGVSGVFYEQREGIQDALTHMEQNIFDTLYVADLSRYSRDAEHQAAIRKRIRNTGGNLTICNLPGMEQDTPENDLVLGMFGSYAQYEHAKIRERCMNGRRNKAVKGIQVCRTRRPYGYHIVTKTDILRGMYAEAMEGKYIVIHEESEWVKQIYQWYAWGGLSMREIARRLDTMGVSPGESSDKWGHIHVRSILKNAAYKGTAVFGQQHHFTDESRLKRGYKTARGVRPAEESNRVYIPVPAMVDEITWDRVQEMLTYNTATSGRKDRRWLLTGLCVCPFCGDFLVGRRKGMSGADHYTCRRVSRKATAKGPCDNGTRYNREQLEAMVRRGIRLTADNPKLIREALKDAMAQTEATVTDTSVMDVLVAERDTWQNRVNAVIRAQIQAITDGIDPTLYRNEVKTAQDALRATEAKIQAMAKQVHHRPAQFNPEQIAALMRSAGEMCDSLLNHPDQNMLQSNEALRRLIDRVVIPMHEKNPVGGQPKGTPKHPEGITIEFAPIQGINEDHASLTVSRICISLTLKDDFKFMVK